eukprot:1724298-Rhodomonas_salina.3
MSACAMKGRRVRRNAGRLGRNVNVARTHSFEQTWQHRHDNMTDLGRVSAGEVLLCELCQPRQAHLRAPHSPQSRPMCDASAHMCVW